MYRLVYYLVHYDCKNYRDFFVRRISGLISKSGSMVDKFSRKKKYSQSHRGLPSTHGSPRSPIWMRSSPQKKISLCREVVLWDLQIDFLIYLTHFFGFWGARGLYITARDLPRAMRPKLVVIEVFRDVPESIFVYRVLRVITQRCVRAESSHSTWSTQTGFFDPRLPITLNNGLIQCLPRK